MNQAAEGARNSLGDSTALGALRSDQRRGSGNPGSSDTRADWSEAFALVPSLQVAYVWHASKFTREVLDGRLRIGLVNLNARIPMALGPPLHVARLRRSVLVQTGSIAPLGVELDSVGRVGY